MSQTTLFDKMYYNLSMNWSAIASIVGNILAKLFFAWLVYLVVCIVLLCTGLYKHMPYELFIPLTFTHDPEHPWRYWNPIGVFG